MVRRRGLPPEKSAVGLQKRGEGLKRLEEMRNTKIATMVSFGLTVEDAFDIMLPPDTQAILRKAHGIAHQGSEYFAGNNFDVCPGVTLHVRADAFGTHGMAWPDKQAVRIDFSHPAMPTLLQGIRETVAIIEDFHVAHTTIEWMDRNMGKGTLRYYFPAIAQLIPDLGVDLVERVVQPERLAVHLPAIRASATLIAASAMLPEMPDQSDSCMQLQFAGAIRFERDGVSYSRDAVFIKI